jgi:hypothetical protein
MRAIFLSLVIVSTSLVASLPAGAQQLAAAPTKAPAHVILNCTMVSAATDKWFERSNKLIGEAAAATAGAGQDAAQYTASATAMRDAHIPTPTPLVIELDEASNTIPNRPLVSSGPVFTSIEIRWQERQPGGVVEATLNRVTGLIVVNKMPTSNAVGSLAWHGTCQVAQKAF